MIPRRGFAATKVSGSDDNCVFLAADIAIKASRKEKAYQSEDTLKNKAIPGPYNLLRS